MRFSVKAVGNHLRFLSRYTKKCFMKFNQALMYKWIVREPRMLVRGLRGPLGMVKKLWVLLDKGTSAPLAQEMN